MVDFIFILLFVAFVLVSALLGLWRNLNKSIIRFVTVLIAAVLTFLIAAPITNLLADKITVQGQNLGQLVLSLAMSVKQVESILTSVPALQEAVLAAPAFALSFVVFPVVFVLLCLISWIVYLCVNKPLRKFVFREKISARGKKKAQPEAPTEEPAVVHAEQQADVAVEAVSDMPAQADGEIPEEAPAPVQTEAPVEETKKPSRGIRVCKRLGGMAIGAVTGVLVFGVLLTPVLGVLNLLPSHNTVDTALEAMEEQQYLPASTVQVIRESYGVTANPLLKFYNALGGTSLGRNYLDSVSEMEANGQVTHLTTEFASLVQVVETAIDGGALEVLLNEQGPNAIYSLLSDKALMDCLMQNLFQSGLLRAAAPDLATMGTEYMAGLLQVPADKTAVYNNMMDNVAKAIREADIDFAGIRAYEQIHNADFYRSGSKMSEIMTEEQYEAELKKVEKLEEKISGILNKAVSGDNAAFMDSVADCIVNDVMEQAASGQISLENYDVSNVQAALSNIDAANIDAGEGDAAALLEQLTDETQFVTDVATVETLAASIREAVENAVSDDAAVAETASTLASVVSDVASAVSSATDENGELDITKLDFSLVSSAVSTMQNSQLSGLGSSVLDMVASSSLASSNSMVSNVLDAVKKGYDSGEDLSGTIQSAGALVNLGAALGGGETDETVVAESLTDLINNLNEFTIDLLPDIVTEDTLTSMGVPEEHADAAYDVVETLLKELMNLQGAENYDAEVDSILSLYELVTSDPEQLKEYDIGEFVDYAVESDAIFNTLQSVSTSNPFGIEISNENDRADLVRRIEESYAGSGKTQRELDAHKAIARLLGLEEEVNLT